MRRVRRERPDEDFYQRFKQQNRPRNDGGGHDKPPTGGGIIRTPVTGRSLNTSQFQMASMRDEKKKKKKKKKPPAKKEPFINLGQFGINASIIDAILGAIIMVVVTSDPVINVISRFIKDFYQSDQDQIISADQGQMQGTVVIKSAKKISFKGRLITAVLFIVLFLIIKNWFVTD